jgi:hypothetical protein
MAIGDTVNLEAHNGATLTILTGGVLLNYTANASGTFSSAAGNVRFDFKKSKYQLLHNIRTMKS